MNNKINSIENNNKQNFSVINNKLININESIENNQNQVYIIENNNKDSLNKVSNTIQNIQNDISLINNKINENNTYQNEISKIIENNKNQVHIIENNNKNSLNKVSNTIQNIQNDLSVIDKDIKDNLKILNEKLEEEKEVYVGNMYYLFNKIKNNFDKNDYINFNNKYYPERKLNIDNYQYDLNFVREYNVDISNIYMFNYILYKFNYDIKNIGFDYHNGTNIF